MNKYVPKQYISDYIPSNNKKNKTYLEKDTKELHRLLSNSLISRNINQSILYGIELIISGHTEKVLHDIINYYLDDINIGCPSGLLFINNFIKYYTKYDYKMKKQHPIVLINDQVIRNFVCFHITLLTSSKQNKLLKLTKISPIDFDLNKQKGKLISKNLSLVNQFIKPDDSKNIIIPLSEICNYFSDNTIESREIKIIYWLSWILHYEKLYHKNNLLVSARPINGIDLKYRNDVIWIIWDIINSFSTTNTKHYVDILYNLFITGYTRANKRSRSNIIIYAIILIINPYPKLSYPIEMMDQPIYINSITNSLKSNLYFSKILHQKAI